MPNQIYFLKGDPAQKLVVKSSLFWKNTLVSLNGTTLANIPTQAELTIGRDIQLPDGSLLHVQLKNNLLAPELVVLQGGLPVTGSATDPVRRFKTAYQVVYFLGWLNLGLGALSILFKIDILQRLGLGITSVIYGVVFLGLAFLTQQGYMIALILAMLIFAMDGIAGFILALLSGYNPGITGVFVRILLLIPIYQGLPAMRDMKKRKN